MGSMQGSFGRSWMRQPSSGQSISTQQQQNPFASLFSQYMQRPMFQAATQQRQPFMNYLPLLLSRGMFSPQQGGMSAQGAQPAASSVPPLQAPPPIAAQSTPQLYQATPPIQQQPAAATPANPYAMSAADLADFDRLNALQNRFMLSAADIPRLQELQRRKNLMQGIFPTSPLGSFFGGDGSEAESTGGFGLSSSDESGGPVI